MTCEDASHVWKILPAFHRADRFRVRATGALGWAGDACAAEHREQTGEVEQQTCRKDEDGRTQIRHLDEAVRPPADP